MMARTLCAAVLGLPAVNASAAEPATAIDCTRLEADVAREVLTRWVVRNRAPSPSRRHLEAPENP